MVTKVNNINEMTDEQVADRIASAYERCFDKSTWMTKEESWILIEKELAILRAARILL